MNPNPKKLNLIPSNKMLGFVSNIVGPTAG